MPEFKCQSCGAKIIVVNDPICCCSYMPMFCLGCSKKMQSVFPSAIANKVFEQYIDVESKEVEEMDEMDEPRWPIMPVIEGECIEIVNKSDREIGGDQK